MSDFYAFLSAQLEGFEFSLAHSSSRTSISQQANGTRYCSSLRPVYSGKRRLSLKDFQGLCHKADIETAVFTPTLQRAKQKRMAPTVCSPFGDAIEEECNPWDELAEAR